jgi:hypothetical protein
MNEIENRFTEISQQKIEAINMFFIERTYLQKEKAGYRIKYARKEGLNEFLKNLLFSFITIPEKTMEYSPITPQSSENIVIFARTEETDFNKILEKINNGSENEALDKLDDLKKPWAIGFEYIFKEDRIIGISKLRKGWNLTKKTQLPLGISSGVFKKIEMDNIINLPESLDFIWNNGNFYIRNKDNYETTLNKREGLKEQKNEILNELSQFSIFANTTEELSEIIGTNKHLLRKLAIVRDNGYYNNEEHIRRMKKLCREKNWELKLENNLFSIDKDNIEAFLTLLNNGRLQSPIDEHFYDTEYKEPVDK